MIKPRTITGSKDMKVQIAAFDVRDSIYNKLIELGEKTFKGDIVLLALQHYEKVIDRRLSVKAKEES